MRIILAADDIFIDKLSLIFMHFQVQVRLHLLHQ
jgi:hypothetical protein